MNAGQLRGMELRIAEDVISILDYLSRLVQGVDGGDWYYMHDKAGELARSAQLLKDAVGYGIEHRHTNRRQAARPQVIIAAITRDATVAVDVRELGFFVVII